MNTVAIIPARYGSSRFAGKPLVDILGKPMVWWVYQQTKRAAKVNSVIVATDDSRIVDVCNNNSLPVVMTKLNHPTAVTRLHEVSNLIDADFYLQINGDEPLIEAGSIDLAIPKIIPQDIEFGTNIIAKMTIPAEVMDPSNIKVVFNDQGNIVYMSRFPIPYPGATLTFQYHKHVGIIGYNKKMLDFYAHSSPGRLESIESIETLRFIDYNKPLRCIETPTYQSISVDTPKDLDRVILMVKEKLIDRTLSEDLCRYLKNE